MSLPVDPSMLTWTLSVRRLNTEHRLTVNALEQVKDILQSTSIREVPTRHVFARPRLVQRMDLNRFPVLVIIKKDEQQDRLSSSEVRDLESDDDEKSDRTRETMIKLEERDSNDDETEEETTYTVETFDGQAKDLLTDQRQVVSVREETTEEQFNAVKETSSSSSTNDSSIKLLQHQREDSPQLSSSFVSSESSTKEQSVPITRGICAERAHLLRWCQQQLSDYPVSDRPRRQGEELLFSSARAFL